MRQYLFHSFWFSLTVVLLATHSAEAKPVNATKVRDNPTISSKIAVKPATKNRQPDTIKKAIERGKLRTPQASARDLIASKTSQTAHSPQKGKQRLIQVGQQPATTTPPAAGNNNSPASQQQLQQPSVPNQPESQGGLTPIPDYLKPSPNPLKFPTRPNEVETLGVQPVTLEQTLEIARQNNRDIQGALLTVERSRAALREALAAEYPNLNLGLGFTNTGSYIFSNEPDIVRQSGQSTNTNRINGSLQLTYNLFTSGLRPATIRQAQEQLRFDQLDFERISEEVRLNVSTDYYNLQQADEAVRIQRSAVTNAQASLRDAQALEQAGVGTRFDVLQAQVQLAQAQQSLTDALSQQRIARRQLSTRLGIADEPVNLATATPVEIAGFWNLTQEQSIVQAYQNRAELEQLLAQRNVNEQQRRIALAQNRPQVSLAASYIPNYRLGNINANQFQDNQNFTDSYELGANVTWNLYDGGAARARARQAEANIAIAENNFATQRNLIRFQVEQAYSTLQSSFANIQTSSVALEQAREALRLARLRFQAGVGTQTDVINAEDALTQAEGNRVTAILDYNRGLVQIQRAVSSGQQR